MTKKKQIIELNHKHLYAIATIERVIKRFNEDRKQHDKNSIHYSNEDLLLMDVKLTGKDEVEKIEFMAFENVKIDWKNKYHTIGCIEYIYSKTFTDENQLLDEVQCLEDFTLVNEKETIYTSNIKKLNKELIKEKPLIHNTNIA